MPRPPLWIIKNFQLGVISPNALVSILKPRVLVSVILSEEKNLCLCRGCEMFRCAQHDTL